MEYSGIRISLILPTFQPGDYIFDCLCSIYNQSLDFSLYELIIVLNGDIEPYYSNIKKYLDGLSELFNYRILTTQQKGVSNARNVGMSISEGEFICFIDDDDMVSKFYLEKLYEKSSYKGVVLSSVIAFRQNINNIDLKYFLYNKDVFDESCDSFFRLRSFFSVPWGKLIHKETIAGRKFDTRFNNGEDSLFITSLTSDIKIVSKAEAECVYYVRLRNGSASRKKIPRMKIFRDTVLLIVQYFKIYFSNPLSYNFLLFLSRIPGVIKNAYLLLNNH